MKRGGWLKPPIFVKNGFIFPQISGWSLKRFELPPPRWYFWGWNSKVKLSKWVRWKKGPWFFAVIFGEWMLINDYKDTWETTSKWSWDTHCDACFFLKISWLDVKQKMCRKRYAWLQNLRFQTTRTVNTTDIWAMKKNPALLSIVLVV